MPATGFFKYFQEHFTAGLLKMLNLPEEEYRNLALKNIKGDLSNIASYEFTEVEYKRIQIQSKGIDEIEFAISCSLTVRFQSKTMAAKGEYKNTFSWCDLVFKATIDDKMDKVYLTGIQDYKSYVAEHPLGDDLVPVLSKEEFEEVAAEILRKYLPNALDPWWNGDISLLPQRMKINCILAPLSTEQKRIFGSIVFQKKEMPVFVTQGNKLIPAKAEVSPNTILIDPTVITGKRILAFNLTIAHECVHYYLHKKAIRFAMLLKNSAEDFVDYLPTKNTEDGDGNFMESQANGISYYLAMPTPSFTLLRTALYRKTASRNRGCIPIASISRNMTLLATRFKVSKSAVRKRMILAGFHEAKGSSDYADGKYLPPTFCAEGVLQQDEEFTISSAQMQDLLAGSKTFRSIIRSGKYIFADNRVVLRHSQYLTRKGKKGAWHMSDYARLHPQECCLIFKIKREAGPSFSLAEAAESSILNRENGISLNYDYEIIRQPGVVYSPEFHEQCLLNKQKEQEVLDFISNHKFGESIKYICDMLDVRNKDLAVSTGIHSGTLTHYFKDEKQPSTEHFTAICIALNISMSIVRALYGKTNCKFLSDSPYHQKCRQAIYLLMGQPRSIVEQFFTSANMEPLIKRIPRKTKSCPVGSNSAVSKKNNSKKRHFIDVFLLPNGQLAFIYSAFVIRHHCLAKQEVGRHQGSL